MTPLPASIIETQLGELHIRPATPDDSQAFFAVLRNISAWIDEQKSAQWIPGAHDNDILWVNQLVQDGTAYVVEYDEQIIATIRLAWTLPTYWHMDERNAGYISTVYVRRNFAHQAIGTGMILWAEEFIRQRNRVFSYLDCYAENTALCAYYEGMGYVSMGDVETYPDYSQRLYKKHLVT